MLHTRRMEIPWVPVASTFGLVGTLWQAVSALKSSVDSMSSFLGAHNAILKSEQERIYRTVRAWRIVRRSKLVKASRALADVLLTPDELRVSRQYDREAMGWSIVVVATLILTVAAWWDWSA